MKDDLPRYAYDNMRAAAMSTRWKGPESFADMCRSTVGADILG